MLRDTLYLTWTAVASPCWTPHWILVYDKLPSSGTNTRFNLSTVFIVLEQ